MLRCGETHGRACRRRWSRSSAAPRRRGRAGLRQRRLRVRRASAAVLLARRAAAARRARRPKPAAATRTVVVVRSAAAAHRGARRRSAGQPGSGGQEPRAAAVAPARPGRHDAARLRRRGADLQPGGAGHAVRRRGARRQPGGACAAPRRPARRPRRRPRARRRRRRWCWWSTIRSRCAASRSACCVREGYRVALAKDGLEALERLAEETPGGGAVGHRDAAHGRLRPGAQHPRRRALARPADHHDHLAHRRRSTATTPAELGVDHYLGKPYSEEDLLALIARYTAAGGRLTALSLSGRGSARRAGLAAAAACTTA